VPRLTDVVEPYHPVARLQGVLGGPHPSVALKDSRMRIDQCDPEYLTNYTSRWSDVSIQRLPSQ